MKDSIYQSASHLAAEEIDSAEKDCPICGFDGKREKRCTIQKGPDVSLLSCPRCFGMSASHMPTSQAIGRYYDSYYRQAEHERVTFHRPIRLARHILSKIALPSGSNFRILDFGGGDGTISLLIAKVLSERFGRHSCVQVVDLTDSKAESHEGVELEYVRDLSDARSGCDLVVASAVFEHVPDLRATLPHIMQKLTADGFLYARTPYIYPFMATIGVTMSYPGHVHDLGDVFWSNLPCWLSPSTKIVSTGPSLVESGLASHPFLAIAAHCLKFPSRVETLWTRNPIWKFYGGWEVFLRRSS